MTASVIDRTTESCVTSPLSDRACPPAALTRATVSRAASSTRSATATRAPSRAKAKEVARPIPPPPPVISADFPSSNPAIRVLPKRFHAHRGTAASLPDTSTRPRAGPRLRRSWYYHDPSVTVGFRLAIGLKEKVRVRRLAITILLTVPLVAGVSFAQQKAGKDSVYEELNLFDEAFERIRNDAVDPVTDAKLIGAAIAGMLSGLDHRSSFIDEGQLKALQAPADRDGDTSGLVVTIDNGQLKVISPEDGSPAARAGVRPGDVIFAINKEPVYDLTLAEAE